MYASVIALAAVVLFITIFLWIKITRGITVPLRELQADVYKRQEYKFNNHLLKQ